MGNSSPAPPPPPPPRYSPPPPPPRRYSPPPPSPSPPPPPPPPPPTPPPPPPASPIRRSPPPPAPPPASPIRRDSPSPPPPPASPIRRSPPPASPIRRDSPSPLPPPALTSPRREDPPPLLTSLPKDLQYILKEADSAIDKSSTDKLYDQLYSSGLFLSHKTKKLWLNKKVNCKCFMLYARALSITGGEDPHSWKWIQLQESSGTMIEAAELKTVSWLEVRGRLDTRKLTAEVLYEVCFLVMLEDTAQGWEVPVNVKLVLPGGKKQEHKENLVSKKRVQWIEIPVGQFVALDHEGGEMEFSLYEIESGASKQGLVIKGVSIKPNPHDYRIPLE